MGGKKEREMCRLYASTAGKMRRIIIEAFKKWSLNAADPDDFVAAIIATAETQER